MKKVNIMTALAALLGIITASIDYLSIAKRVYNADDRWSVVGVQTASNDSAPNVDEGFYAKQSVGSLKKSKHVTTHKLSHEDSILYARAVEILVHDAKNQSNEKASKNKSISALREALIKPNADDGIEDAVSPSYETKPASIDQSIPMPANGPQLEMQKFWMKVSFSSILCIAALFVILSGKYDDETKKWAFSVITLIAGVWVGTIL